MVTTNSPGHAPAEHLTSLPIFDAHGPREECGVVGIHAPGQPVARLAYVGLHALQHRGQESAGIAASDGTRLSLHKRLGLVSQVFDEETIARLERDEGGGPGPASPSATPATRPPAATRFPTCSRSSPPPTWAS